MTGAIFVKCSQLIVMKIIKIVATRCQILRLKCSKFNFGWGSAPHPAGGAYSAPSNPLAEFKGLLLRGEDGKGGRVSPTFSADLHPPTHVLWSYPAVESVPEDGRNVEKDSLAEQYERNPLVVWNHLSVIVLARQRCVPRQVIRIPDPAIVGRVLAVRTGEVFWCPAGDRVADVLVHAD